MAEKPAPPPLRSAPRPQRMTPEQLAEADNGMGFNRPVAATALAVPSPQSTPPTPVSAPVVMDSVVEPEREPPPPAPPPMVQVPKPTPRRAPKPEPIPELVVDEDWTESFRIPVSREVYDYMTRRALDRRVTVRYLCLEALAQAGYPVDMTKVPADGRRVKKRRGE